MLIFAARGGKHLDTVTLADGQLTYQTGVARQMVEGLRDAARAHGRALTDTDLYTQAPGLTNGYLVVTEEPDPPVAG